MYRAHVPIIDARRMANSDAKRIIAEGPSTNTLSAE